jgi:hypothetical protein
MDEMGESCSTYRRETTHTKFWSENLKDGDSRWEDNIKMDHREIGWEGVDCIHLAQVRGQWCATVNTVTFGFHKRRGIS